MIDLSKPWPLGLSRRTALPWLAGLAVAIVALYFVDRPISVWAQGAAESMRAVFLWLTRWGESDWVLIPTFIGWLGGWLLSFVTRDRLKVVAGQFAAVTGFIFVGVGLPGLISALLKRGIGRGRPEAWTAEAPLSFQPFNWKVYDHQSFPSGHATTSFALAMVIAFLWPRLFWPAVLVAALIASSRLFLGEHYPTDLLAGAVLGTLGAYAVRNFFVARGWLFDSKDGRISRRF